MIKDGGVELRAFHLIHRRCERGRAKQSPRLQVPCRQEEDEIWKPDDGVHRWHRAVSCGDGCGGRHDVGSMLGRGVDANVGWRHPLD